MVRGVCAACLSGSAAPWAHDDSVVDEGESEAVAGDVEAGGEVCDGHSLVVEGGGLAGDGGRDGSAADVCSLVSQQGDDAVLGEAVLGG